jgi:NADH:ubiquinone oxidoreductase subunit 6 (subunit J)
MKCWNSAFNAQGLRVIIVVVQVGAVKIYVAAVVEALRKKERHDETQFTVLPKLVEKTSLGPSYFVL